MALRTLPTGPIRCGLILPATYNTASGSYALENNSSGQRNTASGVYALVDNTLGNDNTAAGYYALHNNITGSENTASGVNALYNNSAGNYNTAHGFDALKNNTGDNNTACGYRALQSNSTGSGNTAIGTYAGISPGTLTNATAIGYGASVNASNKIRLGNSSVSVIEGQVAFTFTSDRNEKENFRPVDGDEVLRKVRGLDLPSWNYIGQNPQQFRHYGPVAQEFFAAFGRDEVGTIGTSTTINSGDMLGILMIAVQALEKRTTENKDLQLRITNLQSQNEVQNFQIAELRILIDQLLAQKK